MRQQAGAHGVQHRLWIEAQPEETDHHRAEDRPFAEAHDRAVSNDADWALECALAKSQAVESCCEKAQCRDDGKAYVRAVRAEEDEELADEIAESWKTERGHGEDQACSAEDGIVSQRPPIWAISRVCMLSCNSPARMKSAPVLIPWLTIWITAPSSAISFPAKIPSSTKPMWLTLV